MARIRCAVCDDAATAAYDEARLVAAGEAGTTTVCGDAWSIGGEARLAEISFPIQQYTEGFCPDDALAHGTMFPSLVL